MSLRIRYAPAMPARESLACHQSSRRTNKGKPPLRTRSPVRRRAPQQAEGVECQRRAARIGAERNAMGRKTRTVDSFLARETRAPLSTPLRSGCQSAISSRLASLCSRRAQTGGRGVQERAGKSALELTREVARRPDTEASRGESPRRTPDRATMPAARRAPSCSGSMGHEVRGAAFESHVRLPLRHARAGPPPRIT